MRHSIEETPVSAGEPSITRFRRLLGRMFPSWVRWSLGALAATGFAALGWSVIGSFGLSEGRWVRQGRYGSHFDGGSDLIGLILATVAACYCWFRVVGLALTAVKRRKSESE